MSIPQSEWKWFGRVGHYICGQWCRFHMLTQVGKYLVSTIGEYVHPRHSGGSERAEHEWLAANWPGEDIGWNRKYETMVFLAGAPCAGLKCKCGQPGLADPCELDARGYNDAASATAGHMAMCEKWAGKAE